MPLEINFVVRPRPNRPTTPSLATISRAHSRYVSCVFALVCLRGIALIRAASFLRRDGVDATRLHQTRSWVVAFPISRLFGEVEARRSDGRRAALVDLEDPDAVGADVTHSRSAEAHQSPPTELLHAREIIPLGIFLREVLF